MLHTTVVSANVYCLLFVCRSFVCCRCFVMAFGFWQGVSPDSRFVPYISLVRKSLKGVCTYGRWDYAGFLFCFVWKLTGRRHFLNYFLQNILIQLIIK